MEPLILLLCIAILLVLIVWSCEVFVNAIEHLGKFYNIGDGAVGSIFAAVGTALPETIVPLVAIFGAYFSGSNLKVGNEIGMGAILGSPFLLSTLAMFVTGVAVLVAFGLKKREKDINIDICFLHRDLRFFVIAYTVAVLASFIPFKPLKIVIGLSLFVFYLVYATRTIKKCCNGTCLPEEEEEKQELHISKLIKLNNDYKIHLIWVQVTVSILFLVVFSHFFVENIKIVAERLHIAPLIISLLLAPVATELPEMFNSITWVFKTKDTLALSNITGAMVFQSCIPMTIGIIFTTWQFNSSAIINIILVYCSILVIFLTTLNKEKKLTSLNLIYCGLFYFAYIAYILFYVIK